MSEKQILFIDATGLMHTIEPSLARTFSLRISRRFSHIEPANPFLRRVFRWIRDRVSDESYVAEWTRLWPVLWQVRIVSTGQILGTYWTRKAAIRGEKEYHAVGQWIPGYFPLVGEDNRKPGRKSAEEFSGW